MQNFAALQGPFIRSCLCVHFGIKMHAAQIVWMCVMVHARWRLEGFSFVGGGYCWFLWIWAFILPVPLKTVVLGWEKFAGEGDALEACGLVTLLCHPKLFEKFMKKAKYSHWEMVFASQ